MVPGGMTGLVDEFEAAAKAAGATVTRTASMEAQDALAAAITRPAVGTPLPDDGPSLPTGVTADPAPSDLTAAETGVTPAGLGIAAHGSVVVASSADGEAHASLFPERHLAVLAASDLVADLDATLPYLEEQAAAGRDAVVVTGPSATADMGELVIGAHGPRELEILLLEDR